MGAREMLSELHRLRTIEASMLAVEPFWLRSSVDSQASAQHRVRHYLHDDSAMRAALATVKIKTEIELVGDEVTALSKAIIGWQTWAADRLSDSLDG